MGLFTKALDQANNGLVIGQAVVTQDRDSIDQLKESRFDIGPNLDEQTDKRLKTRYELMKELDEVFVNFLTVLKGRDVAIQDKLQVIKTLIGNCKTGTADIASRSQSVLLDLYTDVLNGL